MIDQAKESITAILQECTRTGSRFNNLYYYAKDIYPIVNEICRITEISGAKLLPKSEYPDEKVAKLLIEFFENYKKGKEFSKISQQFLGSFVWPQNLTECVYTRFPSPTQFAVKLEDGYPTVEELNKNPAHFSTFEMGQFIDPETYIALCCKHSAFKKNNDPLMALEAFLLAHESGIYPPVWVLNYMAGIFKTFHDSMGMKSLDKLFGFKKGRGGPFQKAAEDERDEILCRNVARLERLFGVDRQTACKLEAERLHNTKNFNTTPLNLNTRLSWKTLEDRYRKKWAPIFPSGKGDRSWQYWEKWAEEHGEEFLSNYPSLKKRKTSK